MTNTPSKMVRTNRPRILRVSLETAVFILIAILITSCDGERATWNYVEQKGGIEFGTPYLDGSSWKIPIDVSASGNSRATPDKVTSAPLFFTSIHFVVSGNEIGIVLFYKFKEHAKNVDLMDIGRLPEGEYFISYIDSDNSKKSLGKIVLK